MPPRAHAYLTHAEHNMFHIWAYDQTRHTHTCRTTYSSQRWKIEHPLSALLLCRGRCLFTEGKAALSVREEPEGPSLCGPRSPPPRHNSALEWGRGRVYAGESGKPGGIQLPVRWSCISMPSDPIIAARPLLSSMLSLYFFVSGSW